MAILTLVLTYWVTRSLVTWMRTRMARRKVQPTLIELKIPAPVPATPPALCCGCVYAHIIRGGASNQELIACGYVFPARETPFRVRECTDYRPKRERNRVEIASERAVCILPLDETATDFQAIAAARNGEGEVESSYHQAKPGGAAIDCWKYRGSDPEYSKERVCRPRR